MAKLFNWDKQPTADDNRNWYSLTPPENGGRYFCPHCNYVGPHKFIRTIGKETTYACPQCLRHSKLKIIGR